MVEGKDIYNREEWTELLRTARNGHILHVPIELMNVPTYQKTYRLHTTFPTATANSH
jgi:hypothetical protein